LRIDGCQQEGGVVQRKHGSIITDSNNRPSRLHDVGEALYQANLTQAFKRAPGRHKTF
jgi:hypothetical protein